MPKPIAPCLWFDNQAEEAANYYVSVFKNAKITNVDRFSDSGPNLDAGVVYVEFEINGQPFAALDGGPLFTFSEAISFVIEVADQAELDYYYDTLVRDGGEESQCGWLKDKYGVSWQIVPAAMGEMMMSGTPEQVDRVTQAFLPMKKFDIATLQAAYAGQ